MPDDITAGLASTLASAQGSFFTSLSGTVVDGSGAVIPGADVKVKNNGTGTEYNAVTGTDGGFTVPSLSGGTYSVTVALMGFKTSVLNSVVLNAAVPASVKVTLSVGALEESVTVTGDSALVVQTQSPSISTNLTGANHQPAADQPQRARFAHLVARLQHLRHGAQFDSQRPPAERDQHHARRHERPGQLPEDDRRLLRAPEPAARLCGRGHGHHGRKHGRCHRTGRRPDQVRDQVGHEPLDRDRVLLPAPRCPQREHLVPQPRPPTRPGHGARRRKTSCAAIRAASRRAGQS